MSLPVATAAAAALPLPIGACPRPTGSTLRRGVVAAAACAVGAVAGRGLVDAFVPQGQQAFTLTNKEQRSLRGSRAGATGAGTPGKDGLNGESNGILRKVIQGCGAVTALGATGWAAKSLRVGGRRVARRFTKKVSLTMCGSSGSVGTQTSKVIMQVLPQDCAGLVTRMQMRRASDPGHFMTRMEMRRASDPGPMIGGAKRRRPSKMGLFEHDPRHFQSGPELPMLQTTLEKESEQESMEEALMGIFAALPKDAAGNVSQRGVEDAIQRVNERWDVRFLPTDAERLYIFLGGSDSEGVGRRAFVANLKQLLRVLVALNQQMTLAELTVVVSAAFERFDTDGDGQIDVQELATAAKVMGLQIDLSQVQILHRFFVPSAGFAINQDSFADARSPLEKFQGAVESFTEKMGEKMGIGGIGHIFERVQRELFHKPGDPSEKLARAGAVLSDGAEQMAEAASTLASTAAMGLAVHYISEAMSQASHDWSNVDPIDVTSLLVFLGASSIKLAKELDELVLKEMSEDEALLYARVFHLRSFSQSEFRRLISCDGCRWGKARAGDLLNGPGDDTIKILVKGRAYLGAASAARAENSGSSSMLKPGSTVNEAFFLRGKALQGNATAIATEDVCYISWDITKLRTMLAHHQDLAVRFEDLLAAGMARNLALMVGTNPTGSLSKEDMRACFEAFDTDKSGLIDETELRAAVRELGLRFRDEELQALVAEADLDHNGEISFDEFASLLRKLSSRFKTSGSGGAAVSFEGDPEDVASTKMDFRVMLKAFETKWLLNMSPSERVRLMKYAGADRDGNVDPVALKRKVDELTACLQKLGADSLAAVTHILSESFEKSDFNGDGVVEPDEFVSMVRRMHPDVSESQALALFAYLDGDGNGVLDFSEWKQGRDVFKWATAAQAAVNTEDAHCARNLMFLASQAREVLCQQQLELDDKVKLLQKMAWDSVDELSTVAGKFLDVLGVCAALIHAQKAAMAVDASDGLDLIDDGLDLAPLLIFMGVFGMQIKKHFSQEDETKGLTEQEATCFLEAFEPRGFTVAEFRKLLRMGDTRWVSAEAGERLSSGGSRLPLRVVVDGAVAVENKLSSKALCMGSGDFLGAQEFLGLDDLLWGDGTATQPTTLLEFDEVQLWKGLAHHKALRSKLHRALNLLLADQMHTTYDNVSATSISDAKEESPTMPPSPNDSAGVRSFSKCSSFADSSDWDSDDDYDDLGWTRDKPMTRTSPEFPRTAFA